MARKAKAPKQPAFAVGDIVVVPDSSGDEKLTVVKVQGFNYTCESEDGRSTQTFRKSDLAHVLQRRLLSSPSNPRETP